jgi:hypothetical protein
VGDEVEQRTQEMPVQLVREWAACGIAAAAGRFVPVPLLDDVVKERATRLAVGRTLKAHDRHYPVVSVRPLYGDLDGPMAGARRAIAQVPRKVLLFPVRKVVRLVGAVTGVPSDVVRVLLLGRAVHRVLERGGLVVPGYAGPGVPDPGRAQALEAEARHVRLAFDAAIATTDLQVIGAAVADGLSQGRELAGEAAALARALLARVDDPADAVAADDEVLQRAVAPGDALGDGADRVSAVLRRPELQGALAEFDRQLDLALARP